MYFHDLSTEQLAIRICNSDSTAEAFELYRLTAPQLTEYKFIFASDKGGMPGFSVNRNFSATAAVRSLFKTERVLVLDADTVKEMESGQATYPIDYSISLDANAMSYLVPYMAGKRAAPIPADFQEVFEFIARPDVNVDPLPYFTENLLKLAQNGSVHKIFENLKAYEILRTMDTDWLKEKGEIRSTLSDHELATIAQQHVSKMYMDLENNALMKGLLFRHQYMYAFLIKMAAIQIKSPGSSLGKKMAEFLEFSHSTLATMSGRETAVARAYFERGQKLAFFGKVQKGRDDILASLSNMAWDMWHVRQLEQSMTFRPAKGARYFFPALLTFDRRYIEILDIYPLKACAFKIGSSEPLPFFDGNPFELMATANDEGALAVQKYFSKDAIATRTAMRDGVKRNFPSVVKSLEEELLGLALLRK